MSIKFRLIAIALVAVAAGSLSRGTLAQDASKRTDELNVLDRFVGTWDMVYTHKPAGVQATTQKTSELRKWSLGGKFVHFENPQADNPELPEFHMLLTYDPDARKYPGTLMSGSFRTLITGTWNEETQTMAFDATFPDGNRFTGKHRFIDKDHAESSGITSDPSGKVLLEQTWKQTRRKK